MSRKSVVIIGPLYFVVVFLFTLYLDTKTKVSLSIH